MENKIKIFKLNKNENAPYQKLTDAEKVVHRSLCQKCLLERKKKRNQVNNLSCQFKKLVIKNKQNPTQVKARKK